MTQNTSSAVMQQRREAHDSLDDFPTPPWATRALCEELNRRGASLGLWGVREPCANRGYMVKPLRQYFAHVEAADVHDYGEGFEVKDYLFGPDPDRIGWTFMNPPFRLAEQFIHRALATSALGVAAFVRSSFTEGMGRYERLFQPSAAPPTDIYQFTERVVLWKGVLLDPDVPLRSPHKGKSNKPTSATSYSWLVWDKNARHDGCLHHWIAPCRRECTRPGDYPPLPDHLDPTKEVSE